MLGALTGFGTQAAAVARMLQNPLRDFEVVALVFDVEAILLDGTYQGDLGQLQDYDDEWVQCGFAINTQRLDGDGAPVTVPPYWQSQWPVNQDSGLTQFNEDEDYAIRTHFSRAFTLAPHCVSPTAADPAFWVTIPGWPRYRQSVRVKVKRRLGDQHGLFWQSWQFHEAAPGLASNGVRYLVNGSLWYKMKF